MHANRFDMLYVLVDKSLSRFDCWGQMVLESDRTYATPWGPLHPAWHERRKGLNGALRMGGALFDEGRDLEEQKKERAQSDVQRMVDAKHDVGSISPKHATASRFETSVHSTCSSRWQIQLIGTCKGIPLPMAKSSAFAKIS